MASPRPKTRDSKDTTCRNVLIYGNCRYEQQGCLFNHDLTKDNKVDGSGKRLFNVDSPAFQPSQLQPKKSTFSSQAANAAPFTPQATGSAVATPAISQDIEAPVFNPATIREFTPSQGYDLNTTGAANGIAPDAAGPVFDPFSMSTMAQTLPNAPFNPYAEDTTPLATAGGSYFPSQPGYAAPIQPLQYHLYAPVGQFNQPLKDHQRQPQDFFLREDVREELHKKADAARQVLPNSALPIVNKTYHSLVPLDSPGNSSHTFGNYHSWLYKTVSNKNGNIFCLRRISGHRLSSQEPLRTINKWKTLSNGNIVSLVDFFTSRDFGESSLVFVYSYHPLAKSLHELHFGPTQNGRFGRPLPVTESVLWSYLCQMCNALKAIHSKGLAARCIDPTKIILTESNRIRLGAGGILDVLDCDSPRLITELQQEDLQQLGRLILGIGTNNPNIASLGPQYSQNAIDHFCKRYPNSDLGATVIWLLTPGASNEKTVSTLLGRISDRFLDAYDTALHAADEANLSLMKELENGRVARLALKLGTINERPEHDGDPTWSETGERYQLKLFRDYVFHQVDSHGNPVVDLGHILGCFNKLDAGIDENVHLVSRDNQNSMVVSYKELKKMITNSFNELLKPVPKSANMRGQF